MDSILLRPRARFQRGIGALGLAGAVATVPVWLLAFPVSAQIDAAGTLLEAMTLAVAVVGCFCFARVGARLLEAGWFLLAYSALLGSLAAFTAPPDGWASWPALVTRLGATLLIGVGGLRFMNRRPRGRAHPPTPVVRPGSQPG